MGVRLTFVKNMPPNCDCQWQNHQKIFHFSISILEINRIFQFVQLTLLFMWFESGTCVGFDNRDELHYYSPVESGYHAELNSMRCNDYEGHLSGK